MNDYDKASRYLIKRDAQGFLRWFLENVLLVFHAWIDSRRLALPNQGDLTNDLVAAVRVENGLEAMIVEVASEAKMHNLDRALEYLVRLKTEPADEHSLALTGIGASMLNLTGKRSSDVLKITSNLSVRSYLNLGVHQLNLCDVRAEALISGVAAGEISPWQLGWVPLMQGGDDSSIIKKWRQAAERLMHDNHHRIELGILALTFATLAGCRSKWEASLKGWNMKTCELWDEIRAESRQEGRQEGGLEAMRTLLLRQGKKKFGKAASRKQQQEFAGIKEIERLESLAERLIDVSSWTDLLNGH